MINITVFSRKLGTEPAFEEQVRYFIFNGGEVQVRLSEELLNVLRDPIDINNVGIEAKITSSDVLVALQLTKKILDNHVKPFAKISLLLKYLPYARQDRICFPGEASSALEFMIPMLNKMEFWEIMVYDVHNKNLLKRFKTPVTHVSQEEIIQPLVEYEYDVVVLPDKGAAKKYNYSGLVDYIVAFEKTRDPDTGQINGIKPLTSVGAMADIFDGNRKVLVVDDICDGGRTFIELAKSLQNHTRKDSLYKADLFVTHGIFSQGLNPLLDHYRKVLTTDSFPAKIVEENVKVTQTDDGFIQYTR